jgi:hypothetical protein
MRGIEAEAEFCDAICSGGQPEPRRGSPLPGNQFSVQVGTREAAEKRVSL